MLDARRSPARPPPYHPEADVLVPLDSVTDHSDTPTLDLPVLGIAVAICLWRLYSDVVVLAAEHRLVRTGGAERVGTVVAAYAYGHVLFGNRLHATVSFRAA
ncbi:hypothetical protein ACBJ59_44125 [Nonomuraea sp. MTCD27]|uniref:hypothetical protein n=1 Tax=Nonomuraea sp. MTCD27 TaxID=1676747 RepID=UPI0035C0843C